MKKILLPIFLVVVAAGLARTFYMKQEISERYSLSELRSIAEGANRNLPAMVDEVTSLEKVSAAEKVLEKHYKMVSIAKADLDLENLKSQMTKILIEQSCNNPQSQNLYDNGVSEWFTYTDKNNEHMLTVKIGLNECQT